MVDEATASIDVAAWLGEAVDEMLAGYRIDRLISFRSAGYDEPVNWKFTMTRSSTTTTSNTHTPIQQGSTYTPMCRPSRTTDVTPA